MHHLPVGRPKHYFDVGIRVPDQGETVCRVRASSPATARYGAYLDTGACEVMAFRAFLDHVLWVRRHRARQLELALVP